MLLVTYILAKKAETNILSESGHTSPSTVRYKDCVLKFALIQYMVI